VNQDGLAEALKEHVKDKIGNWKYPRGIEIITEPPKTAAGKIQRFKVRNVRRGEYQVGKRDALDHDRRA
jgi:acyl-coenzyme A synthetase/AMP-(fatty) acid ligase